MTIFVVNGQEKEIKMTVNGIDISNDFIGNTYHGMNIDEDGNYIATQDDYIWWTEAIDSHLAMEALIKQYKIVNDPDEVDRAVQDCIDGDLESQPANVRFGLTEVFGDLK